MPFQKPGQSTGAILRQFSEVLLLRSRVPQYAFRAGHIPLKAVEKFGYRRIPGALNRQFHPAQLPRDCYAALSDNLQIRTRLSQIQQIVK